MVSSGTAVNVANLPSQQQVTVLYLGETSAMLLTPSYKEEALLCGPTEAH